MITFEVLSMFLSIKHLSLKGYFQISVHGEIILAVINCLLSTPPPCNISFPNHHSLFWKKTKKGKNQASFGNSLLKNVYLLHKHKARGNSLPLSGWVPNPCVVLFSPGSCSLGDPAHTKCSLRMEQSPRLLSCCCV